MRRLFSSVALLALLLAGCNTAQPEETPEPLTLLSDAADHIRAADTFRLYVEQAGPPYLIVLAFGNVTFRFANAQYVAPDMLQATAKLLLGEAPIEVDIFARGPAQWFRLPGAAWVSGEFAPGFNPATLIADGSGFQAALTALQALEYVGALALEDGTPVYHLRGTAAGQDVTALVVGLIQATGTLPIDVYIHRETGYPVRLMLTQPAAAPETEDTVWTIDVYDIDAPSELTPPEE